MCIRDSPHLGASTPESEENCAVMAANEIMEYLETGNITHSVNLPDMQLAQECKYRICIINKNVPGVSANIEITGGSSENILLAENGNVELAMTASDVLALALEGKGSFEGKQVPKEDILGVMGGHLTTMQVYAVSYTHLDVYKRQE